MAAYGKRKYAFRLIDLPAPHFLAPKMVLNYPARWQHL